MKKKVTDLRPRRRPTQERSRETIDLILNATGELLEEGGAGSVTTNKIAEQAGLSVGSLYHFFKNKQSIFAALFERQLERFDGRVVGYFGEEFDDLSIEAFVAKVVDAVGEAYLETPALAVLLVTMQADPALDGISMENRNRLAAWLATVLERRFSSAEPAQLEAAAVVIVETVNAVFRRWMGLPGKPDRTSPLLLELKRNLGLYLKHGFPD